MSQQLIQIKIKYYEHHLGKLLNEMSRNIEKNTIVFVNWI